VAALVAGTRLTAIQLESRLSRATTGSIHVARVVRVVPSMSSAFLEAGMDRPVYLRLSDVATSLQNGDRLLVQVAREARGRKGARVTGFITIPGHLAVLRPMETGVLVSRRMSDPTRADELRAFVESVLPEGMGVILRTAAGEATEDAIGGEIESLCERWENIRARSEAASPGTVVSEDDPLHRRALRDLRFGVDEVLASEDLRARAEEIGLMDPALSVEWLPRARLNQRFELERQVEELLNRRVWLKCGGSITIEATEAMLTVDVDTAKCTTGKDLEATALRVNLEAAGEVARQLRLRNIGGLIVIDFVDMSDPAGIASLNKALRDLFAGDPARTKILPVSELGLVEMTRRRDRHPIGGLLQKSCASCGGSGRQLRAWPEGWRALDRLRSAIATPGARRICLGVPEEVHSILDGELAPEIAALRAQFSGSLEVVVAANVAMGDHALEVR
jgi:ribonuclease G